MKRILILALACCLLLLSACSAAGRIEDPFGYGNVSTTQDGRVNGTNDGLAPYGRHYAAPPVPGASGYTGTQRGTGMAGGQ